RVRSGGSGTVGPACAWLREIWMRGDAIARYRDCSAARDRGPRWRAAAAELREELREGSAPAGGWGVGRPLRARAQAGDGRRAENEERRVGIVSMRRRFLFGMAALLGGALVILPGGAGPGTRPRSEAGTSAPHHPQNN